MSLTPATGYPILHLISLPSIVLIVWRALGWAIKLYRFSKEISYSPILIECTGPYDTIHLGL